MTHTAQFTGNIAALCMLLPEISATIESATPGTRLARTADFAYQFLWGELLQESKQIEPCTWLLHPVHRYTGDQRTVADRLWRAIDLEISAGEADDDLLLALREIAKEVKISGHSGPSDWEGL